MSTEVLVPSQLERHELSDLLGRGGSRQTFSGVEVSPVRAVRGRGPIALVEVWPGQLTLCGHPPALRDRLLTPSGLLDELPAHLEHSHEVHAWEQAGSEHMRSTPNSFVRHPLAAQR